MCKQKVSTYKDFNYLVLILFTMHNEKKKCTYIW